MHEVEHVAAGQFLRCVSEHALRGGALIEDRAIGPQQHDDVVGALDQGSEVLLAPDQLPPEAGAFDGIPQGPREVPAVGFALDQVVLRTVLDGGDRQLGFRGRGEHDDGHVGGMRQRASDGVQAGAVGQIQVQQDRVVRGGVEHGRRFRERAAPLHLDRWGRPGQRTAKDAGKEIVVFDKQYVDGCARHVVRSL
jgi:hypothetical protein